MLDLIDGHAHLHAIDLVGQALERAVQAGVNRIVAVGMDLETDRKTLALAEKFPGRKDVGRLPRASDRTSMPCRMISHCIWRLYWPRYSEYL